ncbi:hypothetical protein tb265_12510 [Gemmatimonadetes bacterium T265]|nr:hypothetical protein tb265_12510 [Gemmatimonadetes bacterium T265]
MPVRSPRPVRRPAAGRAVRRTALAGAVLLAPAALRAGPTAGRAVAGRAVASGDVSGTVKDSASGQTLQSAEVSVSQNGRVVNNTQTDPFGRYVVHNLAPGAYTITARFIGYRAVTQPLTVGASGDVRGVDFRLATVAASLAAVAVTASVPVALDTRTGDQLFKQNDYHGAPTNTTSQILQQSIAGAARAPTGEVHIRGQHAEYTYYIDGVPVPSGVSGSYNELFDPQVVNQIQFQTGGWDAEYGNKNAAVVNVTTRVPTGGFHGDVGSYVGQYSSTVQGGRNFNGQTFSASGNDGKLGIFFSGERQFTDMRLEPLVADPAAKRVANFHNEGNDYFGFLKLQYAAGAQDNFNLDLNGSRTRFAVPYDSTGGAFLNDRQTDFNGFANLSYRHQFAPGSGGAPADLFAALFYRRGTLDFAPGAGDVAQFVFAPDTTLYNLSEQRQFNTYGLRLDYSVRPRAGVEFKVGTISSVTRGHEDFNATTQTGGDGPSSNSDLRGSDVGVYAQTAITPVEWFELRTGVRYDNHRAPFAGNQHQVSPRVRLNFYPSPSTTLYAYYGRLFIPTNVEDLRAITSAALGDSVTPQPTLPERDNFYEAGLIQRFPALASTLKLSAYHKQSSPGIDDNTVPGSAIVTSVDIEQVRITGLEAVAEYRPSGPVSAYLNAALNHAYGYGAVTGGFFPVDLPAGKFDLDHDQRLSAVASVTYAPGRGFVSATGIYGSGLTNGVDPAEISNYGTGLFDFNRGIHVKPSAILNASAGYTFVVNGTVLRPQLYVENVFDKLYLLKGAFFSGPSVGRPRSIQLRLNVGI